MELRIVSFNLKADAPASSPYAWQHRQKSIERCWNSLSADIIGTQELTIRAIADLKELFPHYQWVGMGRNGGSRGEFAAIFYDTRRLTCSASDTFWLGKRPGVAGSRHWNAAYPRICTWGIFRENQGNHHLAVYNTHLDHLSPWARKRGIKQIMDFIEKMNTGYPSVLMGDFNAYPETRAMRAFKVFNSQYGHFSPSCLEIYYGSEKLGRSYHGFKGITNGRPIDYIFTSPDITINEFRVDRQTYDGCYPSDHYPLVMAIRI